MIGTRTSEAIVGLLALLFGVLREMRQMGVKGFTVRITRNR